MPNLKNKSSKRFYEYTLFQYSFVFLFFFFLSLWKFQEGLFQENHAFIIDDADGIGGIGLYGNVVQSIESKGFKDFFTDYYRSREFSLGEQKPSIMNFYWKSIYYTATRFVSIPMAWNIIAVALFILTALSAYLLAREMKIKPVFAFCAALFLTHVENFEYRLYEHLLGLGSYYFPILLLWASVRAGKFPNLYRMLLFGFFLGFNFINNEYYGYFGVWFCIVLLLAYRYIYQPWQISKKKFFVNFSLGLFMSLGLVCFAYPNMMGDKILSLFGLASYGFQEANFSRSFYEFTTYSLHNIFVFFETGLPFFREIYPFRWLQSSLWEFTFRVGIVIPIGIFIIRRLMRASSGKSKANQPEEKKWSQEFYPWVIASHSGFVACPTYRRCDIFRARYLPDHSNV